MPPSLENLIHQRITLPGHFSSAVTVEAVRSLGASFELQIRRTDGMLDETILSGEEMDSLLARVQGQPGNTPLVDGHQLRLLVESARIRLAYAYDKQFAVSLSGIRTLPHQIEAVYERMLPQPRLRFLIADDPGAGKTIMAGLYVKEMKLRQAVERILILTPAPLTIQWQEELLRYFNEPFQIIHSGNDQQQLLNLWQRENQVICSVDYAKQPDVRERVWQQRYDLVIIDEAHKCAAYTKRYSGRADDVEKTRRYQLAEKVTAPADHVLLLTATPHHGDDDRFGHFLRLIDPDVFPEPHRYGDRAREVRRGVLGLGGASPWAIRRLKEDLRDVDGRRLFPDRHAQTVAFELKREEYSLYKAVTSFINEFLPQADGRRRQSVALTRTVLQRRLASSANAIYESLRRRLERQSRLLEELETLPASQRVRYLERLRGRLTDSERDEDDLDDQERDELIDSFTAAEQLEQIRAEVAALKDLVEQAGRVRQRSPDSDSKLQALRACLTGSQFDELKDGRGKLLIFTEHRDTLTYLRQHLTQWGFNTCEIHGGMNPHERRQAQDMFRTQAQVCVATEAAGEGINLQFCHLMINYDLPWNPTRLEQRMGRIHRIGQERDVYVYNFVAEQSEDGQPIVEGSILRRLLIKLDQMRDALGPNRVYDVIGEVLALNAINLPEMLREAAYDPRRLDEYLDQIDRIDPQQLRRYEEATGIALAQSNVDFSAFQQHNYEVEERRLMPEYVARQFLAAAELVNLSVEPRADGLWRIEYVPAGLRSGRLAAVQRQGPPEESYRKTTFYKEHLGQNRHLDAVLVGPGHVLYAAVDEVLNERLAGVREGVALFVDTHAVQPYWLHFLEMAIRGEERSSEGPVTLYAEVVAVAEALSGDSIERFSLAWPDILHDLAPLDARPEQVRDAMPTHRTPELDRDAQPAIDFVRAGAQIQARRRVQVEREHYAEIVRDYLTRSFEARIRATENRVMSLRGRELAGDNDVVLARQRAEQDLADLQRTRAERLRGLDRLAITRPGPVRHLASVLVLPPDTTLADALVREEIDEGARRASELAAMQIAMQHERGRDWEPFDVSNLHDGCGFDIRSLGPADPATGQRPVRRIEVKGRQRGQPVRLSTNEWLKARQLGESYWLYVVWDPMTPNWELTHVQDPGNRLEHVAREVRSISHFELSAEAISQGALSGRQ